MTTQRCESSRICRRLHFLRGWSYEKVSEIFNGSQRAGYWDGARKPGRALVPVGCTRFDSEQDWLHTGDLVNCKLRLLPLVNRFMNASWRLARVWTARSSWPLC